MEIDKKKYGEYVKQIIPTHSLAKNMTAVFLVGGIIRALGQFVLNFMMNNMGMNQETAAAWTLLELIPLSILLTGLNIYPKIVKFGGAGTFVLITGFTNSVVASVIEFHSEGEVFGVGYKISIIAGPATLYGVLTSWVLELICWIGRMLGIF